MVLKETLLLYALGDQFVQLIIEGDLVGFAIALPTLLSNGLEFIIAHPGNQL